MEFIRNVTNNQWYIGSSPVEAITVFDATGILLATSRKWLDRPGSSNSLSNLYDVTEVVNRNKVNFSRPEHFFCKGTLYLNAALFHGYSTVAVQHNQASEGCQVGERRYIDILLTIAKDQKPVWYSISELYYDNYELTPRGVQATRIMDTYNQRVASSRHSSISLAEAARLMDSLPELLKISITK